MYKGIITFDLVSSIIETLEARINQIETDRSVKKKFYGATTECIQNLHHHMDQIDDDSEEITEHDSQSGLLMVVARKTFFCVTTGNYVPMEKAKEMEEKLDNVNSLDKAGLKQLYREILSNDGFSDKGTAGLGFVEIARKTGEKLSYQFHKVTDEYSYFTLEIKIPRVLKKAARAAS